MNLLRKTGYNVFLFLLSVTAQGQSIEKISWDRADSVSGYYLAVRPAGGDIKAVLVILNSFRGPESTPPETKLHNVAYANNILTIFVSMHFKLFADSMAIGRINDLLQDVITRFPVDHSTFVLAGHDFAGNIALRYTELAQQYPARFRVQPKAVIGIDCPVDLFGEWHWCEREIKKNYYPGTVSDAKFFLNTMTKEAGTITDQPERYRQLTPFNRESDLPGNEQFLKKVAVRLYYDGDMEWQLMNRRNSLYDTNIPDGSELINRLLLAGNKNAELILSKQPGIRSSGVRSPNALSIVDENGCIQWIIRQLNIFQPGNPLAWVPPYTFPIPEKWTIEGTPFPPPYSPNPLYKGFEEIHFPPGWGDKKTEDYWTVAYLFRLEGKPRMDQTALQDFFTTYYQGLIADNARRINIPKEKLVPVTTKLKKIATEGDDLETYSGNIYSLDYMEQTPITFNCRVHVKPGKEQTPVLLEVSPKPFEHPIWQKMEKTAAGFQNEKGSSL